MNEYHAFITVIFLLLSALFLRQKIKIDLKKESFELEHDILKDRKSIEDRRVKIKEQVLWKCGKKSRKRYIEN